LGKSKSGLWCRLPQDGGKSGHGEGVATGWGWDWDWDWDDDDARDARKGRAGSGTPATIWKLGHSACSVLHAPEAEANRLTCTRITSRISVL